MGFALARIDLTPESRVLDVASGTGALALAATRTGAQVLATDFSPGMMARVAAAGLPNVETRVMDGQALELPDTSFDAVFSIFGVTMLPDWRRGLAEMRRVTRPGGLGRLVRLLPEWTIPSIEVSLVFPRSRELSPAVRAFVGYMKKVSVPGKLWQNEPKKLLSVT